MFYAYSQLGSKCQRRSDHTGVWVPAHEIESTRSENARWNAGRNSKKPVLFLFLSSFRRRKHAADDELSTVGCTDLLILVLFYQDQRVPVYNDVCHG